jgi:hypothetical protein
MLFLPESSEALRQYSNRNSGLVFFQDPDDVSNSQSFAYNYIPVIIGLVLSTLWPFINFDVLCLEPCFQISCLEGYPAMVLFINYNFS